MNKFIRNIIDELPRSLAWFIGIVFVVFFIAALLNCFNV